MSEGDVAYKRRATGKGSMLRESNINRVSCEEYMAAMESSLLHHHTERAHGKFMTQT